MKTVKQKSNLTIIIALLIVLINVGCGLSVVNQNQDTATVEDPIDSLFTIVDISDKKNPTLTTSIRLPYSVNLNNNVILIGDVAYATTARHLHAIDVSTPHRPEYLASLEFDHEIGKVVFFDQNLVVGTSDKIHLIEISDPLVPVVQQTENLPNRNPINDLDTWRSYIFVMGINDALYIYEKDQDQIKLLRTAKMSERWKFIYMKNTSQMVEQIKYPLKGTSSDSTGLTLPLIEHRYFLQIRNNRNDSIRRANEFLGVGRLHTSRNNLTVYDAAQVPAGHNSQGYRTISNYLNLHRDCLKYLSSKEQTLLRFGIPEYSYEIIKSGKMHKIDSYASITAINIGDAQFLGSNTDFQILDKYLYLVNANGFLSIKELRKADEPLLHQLRDRFLSITPLQESRPKSIAVSENYVYVLAATEGTSQ